MNRVVLGSFLHINRFVLGWAAQNYFEQLANLNIVESKVLS